MSRMITNPDGSQSEVFTKEEVDKAAEDATKTATEAASKAATETAAEAQKKFEEKWAKDHPDQSKEIETLKTSLVDAEDKLKAAGVAGEGGTAGGGDKDEQIKRLREEREGLEKKIEEKEKARDVQIQELRNDMVSGQKTELLNKFAGDDADKREKIESEFNNYLPDKNDPASIQTRMEKANALVEAAAPAPGTIDNKTGAGGKGDGKPAGAATGGAKKTDNMTAIGNVLGVKEDEIDKELEKDNKEAEEKK